MTDKSDSAPEMAFSCPRSDLIITDRDSRSGRSSNPAGRELAVLSSKVLKAACGPEPGLR